MLTYTVEVCGVIGLAVACLALPVTVIGFGIHSLRNAFREKGARARSEPLPP